MTEDAGSRTRVLFIGFALPERDFQQLLKTDIGMPTQTQRFGWSVIEAMRLGGLEVTLMSAAPAANFPHNSRIFYKGSPFLESGVRGHTISFINLPGLKHLSRYFGSRRVAARLGAVGDFDAVVVHGVHSPFIWRALRIGRGRGIPVVAILTDPPSLRTRFDGWFSWSLKKVDLRVIRTGLNHLQGVVALTSALAEDFAPKAQSMIMEGIAGPEDAARPHRDRRGEVPVVLYAGSLHASYGLSDLLEAVQFSSGDWRVEIYGRGPMDSEIQDAARLSDRVFFGGLLSPEELRDRYGNADLLVNPRPTTAYFTRYSFPSKLLEYMGTGTPTLTTELPGIPSEYKPYLYWSKDGPRHLAVAIDATFERPKGERERVGAEARRFVFEQRGRASQGIRIAQFLNSLKLPG